MFTKGLDKESFEKKLKSNLEEINSVVNKQQCLVVFNEQEKRYYIKSSVVDKEGISIEHKIQLNINNNMIVAKLSGTKGENRKLLEISFAITSFINNNETNLNFDNFYQNKKNEWKKFRNMRDITNNKDREDNKEENKQYHPFQISKDGIDSKISLKDELNNIAIIKEPERKVENRVQTRSKCCWYKPWTWCCSSDSVNTIEFEQPKRNLSNTAKTKQNNKE